MSNEFSQLLQQLYYSEPVQKIASLAIKARLAFFVAILCTIGVYLFLSLLSYNETDIAWTHARGVNLPVGTSVDMVSNVAGESGAWIADILHLFFGAGAWAVLLWLIHEIYCLAYKKSANLFLRLMSYFFLWACLGILLYAFAVSDGASQAIKVSGVVGYECYMALSLIIGHWGAVLFGIIGLFVVSAVLVDWGVFYRWTNFKLRGIELSSSDKPMQTNNVESTNPIQGAFAYGDEQQQAQESVAEPKNEPKSPTSQKSVLSIFLTKSGLRDILKEDKSRALDTEPVQLSPQFEEVQAPPSPPKPERKKSKITLLTDYGDGLVSERVIPEKSVMLNGKVADKSNIKTGLPETPVFDSAQFANLSLQGGNQQTAMPTNAQAVNASTHTHYQEQAVDLAKTQSPQTQADTHGYVQDAQHDVAYQHNAKMGDTQSNVQSDNVQFGNVQSNNPNTDNVPDTASAPASERVAIQIVQTAPEMPSQPSNANGVSDTVRAEMPDNLSNKVAGIASQIAQSQQESKTATLQHGGALFRQNAEVHWRDLIGGRLSPSEHTPAQTAPNVSPNYTPHATTEKVADKVVEKVAEKSDKADSIQATNQSPLDDNKATNSENANPPMSQNAIDDDKTAFAGFDFLKKNRQINENTDSLANDFANQLPRHYDEKTDNGDNYYDDTHYNGNDDDNHNAHYNDNYDNDTQTETDNVNVANTATAQSESFAKPMRDENDTRSYAMQMAEYRKSLPPLPNIDLLDAPVVNQPSYTHDELIKLAELLEIKLREFNVNAQVMSVIQGPVVTRFEVQLAAGVKVSKVTGISQDLARSLSMLSLRVVEVIEGKPYIGIEIPNAHKQVVKLIELVKTPQYQSDEMQIAMAMGKDIGGNVVIADLAKAPHMLVAGTTGSGKSVLVNAMLISMLLKYTPDELRLILIDPKMLELAPYDDIPHLLTPVVTDMNEAASALSWCVGEMERRYHLMSLLKVRKVSEFNKKIAEAEAQGKPILDPLWRPNDSVSVTTAPKLKPLPLIVVVADEFADMIMQVGRPAEELITRLAQKSRASGIHLMLATQRPSADIITGLIRSNIPSRVALRVNNKIDSRIIIDSSGAEDMLGHGDMLFLTPGKIDPIRVHGALVTDEEVNRITDAWRERGSPNYIETVASTNVELGESRTNSNGEDVLYDEAVTLVLQTGKTSISSLQQELSIGYNRAAKLINTMEKNGVLSAADHRGKRTIL